MLFSKFAEGQMFNIQHQFHFNGPMEVSRIFTH